MSVGASGSLAFADLRNIAKRKDGILSISVCQARFPTERKGNFYCKFAIYSPYLLDSKTRKNNVNKRIQDQRGLQHITETDKSSSKSATEWNQHFDLHLEDLTTMVFVVVELWASGKFKDSFHGCASLPVNNSIITEKPREVWYPLYNNIEVEDIPTCELLLKMKLVPRQKSIERIALSKEPISEIPSFLFTSFWIPRYLKELALYDCNITAIPEDLINLSLLSSLNLSHNKIERLPATIGEFKHLNYLDVSYNLLEDIPEEIVNLHALRNFNVIENPLSDSAKTILQRMPALCQVKMLFIDSKKFELACDLSSDQNNNNNNDNNPPS